MKRKKIDIKIFLTLLIGLVLVLSGCGRKTPAPAPSPSPESTIESPKPKEKIHFRGTKLQSIDGTKKNWVLEAKEVVYDQDKKWASADSIACVFYDADNQEVLEFEAKGARINLKDNSLNFEGEVNAKSHKTEKLQVKKLRWDGEKKKLIGDGAITITRKGSVMSAKKMTADPALKDVELSGDVKVIYTDEDSLLKF